MADSKLTALTENTAPTLGSLVYMVYDPGGSPLSQKVTVQNLRGGYVLTAACGASSPADATTYYFGSLYSQVLDTNAVLHAVRIPRAGTITYISLWHACYGTLASSETSTMSFRLNNTTDTTISSVVALNTGSFLASATPSIAVAVGDYFEIKWVTPTFATNPTNVYFAVNVYVS